MTLEVKIEVKTHEEVYANAAVVNRLKRLTNSNHVGSTMKDHLYAKQPGTFVIARHENVIVGWMLLRRNFWGENFIDTYVRLQQRRMGVGTAMMNAMKEILKSEPTHVGPWTQAGRGFYKKAGLYEDLI